jgi:hypothetical protein
MNPRIFLPATIKIGRNSWPKRVSSGTYRRRVDGDHLTRPPAQRIKKGNCHATGASSNQPRPRPRRISAQMRYRLYDWLPFPRLARAFRPEPRMAAWNRNRYRAHRPHCNPYVHYVASERAARPNPPLNFALQAARTSRCRTSKVAAQRNCAPASTTAPRGVIRTLCRPLATQ